MDGAEKFEIERLADVSLDCPAYLEFINAANEDNEDWVPFDSTDSLKIILFSNPRYYPKLHFMVRADEAVVADLYVKIHSTESRTAEIELNIAKNWRGKGLGERLVSRALANLDQETEVVRIIVSPGSSEVIPYCTNLGFKVLKQVDMVHDLEKIESAQIPLKCSINKIKFQDLEEVTRLRNEIFSQSHTVDELKMLFPSKTPEKETLWNNILKAAVNRKIVGYCIAGKDNRVSSGEGWIAEIGVVREHRRKGIGKTLLLKNLRWLKSIGCTKSTVNTNPDNTSALKLYESVGFKVFRTKEKILELKRNRDLGLS